MEILFLSHCYKVIHYSLVKEITSCLEKCNHKVSSIFDESVTYDCILVFNKKKLKNHSKAFEGMKKPVIYLFCISDVVKEYPVLEHVTRIIAFKDKVLKIQHLPLVSAIYQELILPVDTFQIETMQNIQKQNVTSKEDNRRLIYVNLDDEYFGGLTFLKILSLLNLFRDYEIHYQPKRGIGREFINEHIKLINPQSDINDSINRADIVIASGYVAYLATQRGKKTIVVGEKGYGGVVSGDNLEYHMANFFQGRNGGKFDEHIPYPLLSKAIGADVPDMRKIHDKLLLLHNRNQDRFIQLIEFIVSNVAISETDPTTNYIFNQDYTLIKRNNRFWLCKRVFMKLYKSVNESEVTVIYAFQKPSSIGEVLNMFPKEYGEIIREYVHELITKRILIPVVLSEITGSEF